MTQKQIYSFVNWTPHMTPVNIIQPIMISDLKHSHKSPIVGIRWRSPFHDFNETGKLVETCDGKISMQFETCGLDGTIFLWDMSQKPEILTASTIRRFKLKRKSSALKIVESPYKNLDLKPIYTVLLKRNERSLIVTHMTISKYSNLVYEGELDETRLRIEDKVTFKPVIHREYAHIKWDGQEETEDEEIQPEPCKFINYGCYHDGPITQTAISDNGTVLTVGGSVFALWKDTFQFSPILWRKCNDYVCEGRWHSNNQARFNIVKNNGFVEHWMLHKDSYRCLDELVVNNGSIFVWKEHPRHFKNHVVGVGDEYGNFRLHNMEKMADNGKDVEDFGKFIDKEIAVRQNFKIWQSKWSDKHKSNEEAKRETKKVSIYRGESSKSIVSKPKLTPFELAKIQWDKDDKKRIKETVRNKTRLDITELKMLKEPYEVIQRDKQEKKQKLLSHAKKGDEILENTLETIFPQFMKTLKTNVEDPYAPGYTTDEKSECFNSFQNICHEAKTFIEENPYTYEFNMNDVIKKFKNRAKSLHEQDEEVHPHKLRLIEERKQKKIEEEQRRLAEEEERRRQEDLAEIERKKIKRKPKKSAKEKKPAEKVEATKAMKTEEIKNEKVDDKPAELKNN
ncbi:unnamed protein product [Brassicogethes aeneus]|uniref:Uncharacterized protein n=1 Tax=Brassicogethes aeneus TaxID=1431903 RepID=A0A9P0B7I7_BRAAE|nr:unnamed protein product [Brassicogethes aeneus]